MGSNEGESELIRELRHLIIQLREELADSRQQIATLQNRLLTIDPHFASPASPTPSHNDSFLIDEEVVHQTKRKHVASDDEQAVDMDQSKNQLGPSSKGKKIRTTSVEPTPGPSRRTEPETPTAGTTKTEKKPPPIVLPKSLGYSAVIKSCREHGIDIKAAGSPDTKLFTKNVADFNKLRELLKENQIGYHTFSLPAEKKLKVVLRGVPETLTEEEIKEDLAEKGYQFQSVKRLKNKHKAYPLVLVNTDKNDAGKQIFNCTEVLHAKITTEPKKRPTRQNQCYRCQDYGHVQQRCTAPYRCVKCARSHPSWECKLGKFSNRTKCCHCGANHPASYRECPECPDMKKRQAEEAKRAARVAAAELRRHYATATTTPGTSYAQATRTASNEEPRMPPSADMLDARIKAILDEVLPGIFRRFSRYE